MPHENVGLAKKLTMENNVVNVSYNSNRIIRYNNVAKTAIMHKSDEEYEKYLKERRKTVYKEGLESKDF